MQEDKTTTKRLIFTFAAFIVLCVVMITGANMIG